MATKYDMTFSALQGQLDAIEEHLASFKIALAEARKQGGIMTYRVLAAMSGPKLCLAIIEEQDFLANKKDVRSLFPDGATQPRDHGTVEITGNALDMVPSVMVSSY